MKVTPSEFQVGGTKLGASSSMCHRYHFPHRPLLLASKAWLMLTPWVRALEKCGLGRWHGGHDERKGAGMATISPRMPTSLSKEPHLPTECHCHRQRDMFLWDTIITREDKPFPLEHHHPKGNFLQKTHFLPEHLN